jgi:hypothetical protein
MEIQYIVLAVAILAGLWYYFYVYRKSQSPVAAPAPPTTEEQYADEDYVEEEYVEEEYEEEDEKPKEKSK